MSTDLQVLYVECSGPIRVKKVKSLLYFLVLLLGQFDFSSLFPLSGGRSGFTVTRSLRKK